ncbi:PREDICTED: ethylene-responsive mRNAion [Prunus dulcis]|uniref:PREDICTED: ethylene-responsive mRNAion n=1 Tax=Prunus dulcis TaxID=3755 RepID=A0A5E4EJ73_PRUDU|nr:PREDICTED: ethylene-responsive mRNAion [Prunus dulcis]
MRKWVAEIREPNKRSRIWLGSYTTLVVAARAYDTAVFYLRCPSARLNFPELVFQEDGSSYMTCRLLRYERRLRRLGQRSTPSRLLTAHQYQSKKQRRAW